MALSLSIVGKALIEGSVTIDTDNAAEDGTITFSTTIDGVNGGSADNLTILAGDNDGDGSPGGALSLGGIIGGTQALTKPVGTDSLEIFFLLRNGFSPLWGDAAVSSRLRRAARVRQSPPPSFGSSSSRVARTRNRPRQQASAADA